MPRRSSRKQTTTRGESVLRQVNHLPLQSKATRIYEGGFLLFKHPIVMSWHAVIVKYSSKYKTKCLSLAKRPLLNGTFTKGEIEENLERQYENRGT